jgi:hypothetical protein
VLFFEPQRRLSFLAAITLLFLPLAGCQPAPTPFAHTPGTSDPIVSQHPDVAGVTVRPITGLTKRQSDALSVAMVNAFMAMEIPAATTGKNRRSSFVNATAKTINHRKNQSEIQIEWTLTDSRGRAVENHKSRHNIRSESWKNPSPKSLSPWVKTAAQQFAHRILGSRADAELGRSASLPRLHVWRVDGIDGTKSATLRRAMERALKSQKFEVSKGLEGAALVIAGSVFLGSVRDGKQPIEINWSVLDTKGKQVGKLDQRNSVAVSTVKNDWQNLSSIITRNAAGGVSEIVNRLPPESFPQGTQKGKKTRR